MSVRLPLPIDPASTGADWSFDITFSDLSGQAEDWSGDQVTFNLVPKDAADRAGNAFRLTSEGGDAIVLADGAGVRVSAEQMAGRGVGAYDFELIRRRQSGAVVREVVGSAVIEQGLGQVVDGVATARTGLTGAVGSYRISRGPNAVRVERGGGPSGDDAYQVAVREGFGGSREEWLASLVGRSPTDAELAAMIEPRVAEAVEDRLAQLIPTMPDPVLSSLRFVAGAAAGTVLAELAADSLQPGAIVSISPNDGRVVLTGNQQDGFKIVRGATAMTAGDFDLSVRYRFAPATNGPLHSKTFTLMAMAADRYMVGLTRIRANSGNLVVAAAGTERKMSVLVYGAPQYATNGYRFCFSGFASVENNGPAETVVPGNDTVIHGVWAIVGAAIAGEAIVGGSRYRLTFGGAPGVTIASGASKVYTDEANFLSNVAREANVVVATEYSTAVGQNQIPNTRIQKHRGERIWGAAAGVSLTPMLDTLATPSTAALDTSYGLLAQPSFYGPDCAGMKGWDGRPVVMGLNDSIGDSRDEYSATADARGNLGVLRRWFDVDDPTHHRTPHYLIGMPGATSVRELAAGALKRWDNIDQLTTWNGGLPPFTKVVDQLGQNDYNAVYATMRANHKGAVQRVKARYPGITVVAFGVLPRTTSANFFETRAGQTRSAGNEWPVVADAWGSGFKWQLEKDREAGLDGELTGYIATRPYWYDPVYPGTWPDAEISTLVTPVGTDGATTYDRLVMAARPELTDLLRWGAGWAGIGRVASVAPNVGGGWLVILDRATNAIVAAASAGVLIQSTTDGVHPMRAQVMRAVAAIPQSEKAKLAA